MKLTRLFAAFGTAAVLGLASQAAMAKDLIAIIVPSPRSPRLSRVAARAQWLAW